MTAAPGIRTVVVHVDDVAMCHGANQAYLELFAAGFATAGSIMVPCPWFLEIAEAAAVDGSLDLGVHLTLTAEKARYKWGPVSGVGQSSGLVDDMGFFWPAVASVRSHGELEAAETELRAQIDKALAAGIDVTHLDAHMGVMLAPELIDVYIRLGEAYALPILLTDRLDRYGPRNHLPDVAEATYQNEITGVRAQGLVLFDLVAETDWRRGGPARAAYEHLFTALPDGLSFVALHPNAPGELQAIEPESAHIRIDEYELFSDLDFQEWVDGQGLDRVGMRELRDQLRGG